MTRKLMLLVVLTMLPLIGRASNFTFQGNFAADDSLQLFSVSILAPAAIDIRSYGYAGGATSTGTTVPRGGFDTVLTLFSASGAFINDNDDGNGVAADPATGLTGDARITANLAAGNYILALTQYDNFSSGNLADGFVETGNPNFTAGAFFAGGGACPGNMFRDISETAGRCRNGNWTVEFVNVASVTAVPEPSALLLAGIGFALLLAGRFRNWRKAGALVASLVAALTGVSLQAQTDNCPTSTNGPDYCHASDFLNGQRTLLQVTDLQAFRLSSFNNGGDRNNNIGNGQDAYQITTSGSQQTLSKQFFEDSPQGDPSKPLLSFSAHMFAQRSASTLTTLANFQNSGTFALWFQNVDALNGTAGWWTPLPAGNNPTIEAGAVGDVTLDGYDDLALSFDDGRLVVLTPKDVTNVYANYNETILTTDLLKALAIGDFNGDGRREVAGITLTANAGPAVVIYTVDPTSLAITRTSVLNLTPPSDASVSNPVTYISLARGRFNSVGHDQLAVAFATNSGSVFVEVIDFALGTLNPVEGPQLIASTVSIPLGHMEVKTASFALPGNTYDQIVFHESSAAAAGGKFFKVLSVDPTSLALTAHAGIGYDPYQCALPIQVGNFDNRQTDPLNPNQTQPNLNSQIAFMYCTGSPRPDNPNWDGYNGFTLNIYNVDPETFNITGGGSQIALGEYFWIGPDPNVPTTATFVATDLQGRSVTLGEPTKISINNTIQPSAIVGVPPMHVDFIDPGDNNGPRVFNVSVVPDGFKTTFNQQNSSSYASSTANTTSWSFGAKETASAGVTVGDPDVDGIKATDTFTAAQTLKGSHENDRGSYKGKSYNLSTTTGFGDDVTYTDSQFNIWVYPVIGQTVCPAAKPNCQPGEKVPLTIQFSATNGDSQQPEAVQGQALQWYQPPWEPGNVLSYPANLDQLKSHYPDLTQLTNDPTGFLTDGSTITQTATWSGQGEVSDTTSLKQNYSFENDFSVNGSIGVGDIGSVQLGADLDVSGSVGFSSLIKGTTTLGSSTGLEISKPGTFPAFQNYGYAVNPYVVGIAQPGGVVDNQPVSGTIQTGGVLRAVFTADPLSQDPDAGGWWSQAYTAAPDVALNHPSRWTYTATSQPSMGDPPSNCLLTGDGKSMDCAELSPRFAGNPWLSIFHFMRGFFISSGVSPGQGPQLEQAKAGDTLTLQTRVYNYSLLAMPDGAEVHVRFYFMPWNTVRNLPAETDGNSYLISEEKVAAIPPFNESTGANAQPNWTLVTTKFDTSKFQETKSGNAHLVFWVSVWIQDSTGQIIGEMPGHGLTAIPPAGTLNANGETTFHFRGLANSYQGATDFEECQQTNTCYSNNLGLYKQVFELTANALGAAPPTSSSLEIGKVTVTDHPANATSTVVLSATISAKGAAASGVSVNFYEGDPNQGGRLFAVERIPRIPADGEHLAQTTYQSHSCGVHQLFAVINRGRQSEVVRRVPPVRIPCTLPALSQALSSGRGAANSHR